LAGHQYPKGSPRHPEKVFRAANANSRLLAPQLQEPIFTLAMFIVTQHAIDSFMFPLCQFPSGHDVEHVSQDRFSLDVANDCYNNDTPCPQYQVPRLPSTMEMSDERPHAQS
jgi:hypothetical protein